VSGVYEANGGWLITVTGLDTFTLDGSIGTGAFIAGSGTVQRWKVTLAGGGAPGFTDDATDKNLLGRRIRFDSSTTTASLSNQIVDIWSNGVDTIIPDRNFNPADPVPTDIFYIEEPGIGFDRLEITGISQTFGSATNAINLSPFGIDSAQVLGLRLISNFLASGFKTIKIGFIHAAAWNITSGWLLRARAEGTYWNSVNDGVLVRVRCGGYRLGNTTNPDVQSIITDVSHIELLQLTHITTTLEFIIGNVAVIETSSACVFRCGISLLGCGLTGTTTSGTIHTASALIGNNESSVFRLTRILGPTVTGAGLFIHKSNVLIRGVEISGMGAAPAVSFFGNGGFVAIRQLYGSQGNTGYGLDFGSAPPGNFAGNSRNWNLAFVYTNDCAVRGSTGAIRLGSRGGSAALEYADLRNGNIKQMEDAFGNKLQTVSTAPGQTLINGLAEVGRLTDYLNGEAVAVPAYRLLRQETGVARSAVLAQANNLANAIAVLGASINASAAVANGGAFLITHDDECWIEFDRTGAHPAPSLGIPTWLSVDTPGLAQADAPASAATNQSLPVGAVVAIHPVNADIGLVKLNLAAGPITA